MKTLIKKFGDLDIGDFFIGFPCDGDNNGHGGYLVAHYLYKKTGKRYMRRFNLEEKKYKQSTLIEQDLEVIHVK